MKLTKNLKRVIVTQFKGGDDMAYLATLYGLPLERVEDTIRVAMVEQDNQGIMVQDLMTAPPEKVEVCSCGYRAGHQGACQALF